MKKVWSETSSFQILVHKRQCQLWSFLCVVVKMFYFEIPSRVQEPNQFSHIRYSCSHHCNLHMHNMYFVYSQSFYFDQLISPFYIRWNGLEVDNLSLDEKICMKMIKISALVTNIHLTTFYHGNGNKNSKFILSGKWWNFIKLSWTEEWLLSFFITLKSPLIRKRPRNSELRNKLKFNKDNYRLRLVFKLI